MPTNNAFNSVITQQAGLWSHLCVCCVTLFYTPVHLVESVENCKLCMRQYLACSSYANVMHRELAITRALRYDASAKD